MKSVKQLAVVVAGLALVAVLTSLAGHPRIAFTVIGIEYFVLVLQCAIIFKNL